MEKVNVKAGVKGFIVVPVEERFWSKVDRYGANGCWVWTATTRAGYGIFWKDGRKQSAHRVSWEIANGQAPPAELEVCHRCDNPPCVNPWHLFLGTHSENMLDGVAKGRKIGRPRKEAA